jgi:hypothetical protein
MGVAVAMGGVAVLVGDGVGEGVEVGVLVGVGVKELVGVAVAVQTGGKVMEAR